MNRSKSLFMYVAFARSAISFQVRTNFCKTVHKLSSKKQELIAGLGTEEALYWISQIDTILGKTYSYMVMNILRLFVIMAGQNNRMVLEMATEYYGKSATAFDPVFTRESLSRT